MPACGWSFCSCSVGGRGLLWKGAAEQNTGAWVTEGKNEKRRDRKSRLRTYAVASAGEIIDIDSHNGVLRLGILLARHG